LGGGNLLSKLSLSVFRRRVRRSLDLPRPLETGILFDESGSSLGSPPFTCFRWKDAMKNTLRMLALSMMLLAVPVLSACASGGERSGGSMYEDITREEAQQANVSNAYDLIERQRAQWLRSGSGQVLLYVNGTRQGQGVGIRQVLEGISVSSIERIEWAEGPEARRLPQAPTSNVRGAILVITR